MIPVASWTEIERRRGQSTLPIPLNISVSLSLSEDICLLGRWSQEADRVTQSIPFILCNLNQRFFRNYIAVDDIQLGLRDPARFSAVTTAEAVFA